MKTPTVNDQVTTLLNNAGVKFNIIPAGFNLTRDNWNCDGWILQLHKKNNTQMFEYYTGIGHRKHHKPVTPEVCGIINSLNIDSQAVDESFPNWCDNYGYDSDSIKALNVYTQCCDNAKKYYSVVDRATREQLEDILADY